MRTRNLIAVVVIAAVTTIPMAAEAAWNYANTHEVVENGITYNVVLDGSKASIGTNLVLAAVSTWSGEQELVRATRENISGALTIPDVLTINGTEYVITAIGSRGFWNYTKLTGVIFPANLETLYQRAFLGCSALQSIWFKGPATVDAGAQNYTTIAANSNGVGQMMFSGCNSLKLVLVGPNVKRNTGVTRLSFCYQSSCTFFLPVSAANKTWSGFDTEKYPNTMAIAGSDANIIYYGPEQELDIEGADGRSNNGKITFMPNSVHTLTNVLSAASVFKSQFELDVRVSVTNALDLTGVRITEGLTNGVTFDRIMFSAKTQDQLDAILRAFPNATPIAIDPTGLTENMFIPDHYPNVFVKTVSGVTIKRMSSGFMIVVK